jgi:hypothetical protein
MLQYPPSIIAAASLCEAYKKISKRMHPDAPSDWEKKVEYFTRESLGFNKEKDGAAE